MVERKGVMTYGRETGGELWVKRCESRGEVLVRRS